MSATSGPDGSPTAVVDDSIPTTTRKPLIPQPPNYGNLRLDRVGIIYLTVFSLWTTLFLIGLGILLRNRRLSFIRLKNVPLVVAALVMLHLQLSFDILAYPLNGTLPCALEFWIMNICLPLGIALFQAQNMQLFSMYWHQQHLLFRSKNKTLVSKAERMMQSRNPFVRWWGYWCTTCYLRRMYVLIIIGTIAQIIVGLVIFLISRKFHPTWGIVSTAGTAWGCRGGWEWFPSGIWQALWTYAFGPVILFKIRNIQDTHRWKLQTTLAILFSLPALPLWLFTWLLDDFYVVNSYWTPNLWFVPGLAAMEFCILFFPLLELYEFRKRQRKAANAHAEAQFSKYSIAALEQALRDDIDRLEEFAAVKDFSGENIIFLKRVENWKDRWTYSEVHSVNGQLHPKVVRDLFDAAKQIFHDCISPETSPFPINLDESVFQRLQRVLCDPKPVVNRPKATRSIIAPFADDVVHRDRDRRAEDGVFFRAMLGGGTPTRQIRNPSPTNDDDDERPPTPPRKNSVPFTSAFRHLDPVARQLAATNPAAAAIIYGQKLGLAQKPIPAGFSKYLFDESESEIKKMVLENTWIRYVDARPEEDLDFEKRLKMGEAQGQGRFVDKEMLILDRPVGWREGKFGEWVRKLGWGRMRLGN